MRIGYNPKGGRIKTDCAVTLDRGFIAHFQVTPVASDDDGVLAATALAAAAADVVEGITSPAVPRNLTVVGNAAGIAGDVVITGTNYAGEEITETFALNGATAVVGTKAFKTVTKVALPAETHAGTDTVKVGWGEKLGLPYLLAHNTVLFAFLDNTKEGTAPAVAVSATALESNTVDLNSVLNGKIVDVYLIV